MFIVKNQETLKENVKSEIRKPKNNKHTIIETHVQAQREKYSAINILREVREDVASIKLQNQVLLNGHN